MTIKMEVTIDEKTIQIVALRNDTTTEKDVEDARLLGDIIEIVTDTENHLPQVLSLIMALAAVVKNKLESKENEDE